VASTLLHGVLGMFPATRMKFLPVFEHGVRVWLRPSQKEAGDVPADVEKGGAALLTLSR